VLQGFVPPSSFRKGMQLTREQRQAEWISDVTKAVSIRTTRRRLIITEKEYIGLGPRDAAIGDVVALLIGCNVPVVLRPKGDNWFFVGEAYVCGIMDGELMPKEDTEGMDTAEHSEEQSKPKDLEIQQILLV
jgi:hypothetical protein